MIGASKKSERIRYAVVGLGHIAQVAVLPAFAHAKENSELAALVSDDPKKREEIGKKYGIERTYSYEDYGKCLASGVVDAVYIALPNHMHCEYTVRALDAGVNVLCEKPMAVTEEECQRMIEAAERMHRKLMIAYRLHFEEANLKAVEVVQSGKIGEARVFNSLFSLPVAEGNIRVKRETGGGTLYDIGVYCINASRYLFRDEPTEVVAFCSHSDDPRLAEIDESTSAVMRFPGDRLASFTSSFGVAAVSNYQVLATKGDLRMDPAYSYAAKLQMSVTIDGKTTTDKFSQRDQFAPELIYFSNCILEDKEPEPSGEEGLADVRIVRALYQSSETGQPVKLPPFTRRKRPSLKQEIKRPAVSPPKPVHAESPTGGKT